VKEQEEVLLAAQEAVLQTQPHSLRVILDSPPGAGKTGVVEKLALQSVLGMGERCMIAGQTRNQCLDLARRLRSSLQVGMLWSGDLSEDLQDDPNVVLLDPSLLPSKAGVVIATSAKWSGLEIDNDWFDLQIVEEAYQLHDARWRCFAPMASRHVLVGDPGQIDPVTTIEVRQWAGPDAPHNSAPHNLQDKAGVVRLTLPASRRVPGEGAELVSEAMYPSLSFKPTSRFPARRVENSLYNIDEGKSIIGVESLDPALEVVRMLEALEGSILVDEDARPSIRRLLQWHDCGVVCARRKEVRQVNENLGNANIEGVFVETADRWQGLEREVVLVLHPLGTEAGEFSLKQGRLSVMLSRHRVLCIILSAPNCMERLGDLPHTAQRELIDSSQAQAGFQAHQFCIQKLKEWGQWHTAPAGSVPHTASAGAMPHTIKDEQ
jgi:hypothetical protein